MNWSAPPLGTLTVGLLCSGCGRSNMMASGGHCGCDGLPVCYHCGNEIGCGISTCKYIPCRAGRVCTSGCTGLLGLPGPLPLLTYSIWLIKRTNNPIGYWYASLGPMKPGWPHGDPYRLSPVLPAPGPQVSAPVPVPAPSAAPTPKYDDSSMAILNPEQVEHKRAVLTNRVREALSTAVRLGHDVTTFVVMDVRSQQPLSFPCGKCGFDLIIEQRLHPEDGKEAVRGPASVLDCKPGKK